MPGPRTEMHQQGNGPLMLLLTPLHLVLSSIIPPVTLATITAHILIHFCFLDQYITAIIRSPSIENVCASYAHVWYKGDWPRLFLSPWFHYRDWPLYFSMLSFIWKGISLEKKFGSPYFAYLIVVFSVLKNGTQMVLDVCFALIPNGRDPLDVCSAGFWGVVFALKVLTTHQWSDKLFSVPSHWACWVELIIVVFILKTSITSILAGILVGLAYVKGPLKPLMDAILHLQGWVR